MSRVSLQSGQTAWAVTGQAEARTLLLDTRLSVGRQRPGFPFPVAVPVAAMLRLRERDAGRVSALGGTLIGADPPLHTRQRRPLIPSFTARRIAGLRPRLEHIVNERIEAMLAAGPPADLLADFALPVPSRAICELLGVPYADHEYFEEQSRLRLDPDNGDALGNLYDYLDELIRAKQAEPGQGLLDELLHEQVAAGKLDRDELVAIALVLLIAGHDTTTNMIALGTLALLEHPDQFSALRENPDLVPDAVEELLRYLSVVAGMPRVTTEDIEIGGQVIKAGEGVLVATAAVNRDPTVAEDPGHLDVHRSPGAHLAFGFGIHQCLGANLARAEMQIAFQALAERMPTMRLAVPLDELKVNIGLVTGLQALPITW